MWFFQNPEIIFDHFFRIFNLDIFWVLILQKRIGSRYLVPITPTTVLSRSFWNFTGALRMVWRYACVFFRILKLFFITGFLLQYLGKWYRNNGPLVNLPIFNTSNKNKAGDINSPWNLLVFSVFLFSSKSSGCENSYDALTLTMLWADSAVYKLMWFFLYFSRILDSIKGDDLHKMSNYIFWGKWGKYFNYCLLKFLMHVTMSSLHLNSEGQDQLVHLQIYILYSINKFCKWAKVLIRLNDDKVLR